MHMISFAAPPVPPSLLRPAVPWVFNWVVSIVGASVILAAAVDSLRRRRLTWGFLFLVNSMLIFWMETMGDWGQELRYSPVFAAHHLLDWIPLKTPTDPAFMPLAYAVYWTVHAIVVLAASRWLVRRFGWSLGKAILVLALPVNYAWDFFVEASAAALGWWTYDPAFGPYIQFANGGRMTLLWTIGIMSFWPNLMAYWAGKPPARTLNHFERFFGLERWTRPKATASGGASSIPMPITSSDAASSEAVGAVTLTRAQLAVSRESTSKTEQYDALLDYEVTIPRWKFELARFFSWFVVFQISFFALGVVPLVAMRLITTHDSIYIP